VNLSTMNTFQQWLLWMHIMAGSAIWVSIFVVYFRKRAFEKRLGRLVKQQKEESRRRRTSFRSNFSRTRVGITGSIHERTSGDHERGVTSSDGHAVANGVSDTSKEKAADDKPNLARVSTPDNARGNSLALDTELGAGDTAKADPRSPPLSPRSERPYLERPIHTLDGPSMTAITTRSQDHISFSPSTTFRPGGPSPRKRRGSMISFTGVGAAPIRGPLFRPAPTLPLDSRPTMERERPVFEDETIAEHPIETVPWARNSPLAKYILGRNSQFHGLTLEERERLGGIEYRAITLLSRIVPLYFILFQLIGCLGLGAWMAYNASDTTLSNGIAPWWNGAFNAVSAFNNSGMSLLDANMIPFQQSVYPVLTMGLLILAGNTAYPVFLRLILWVLYKACPTTPSFCEWKSTLRFCLDHPRRVYTNLFPSTATWWLLLTLIFLNGTDWVAFELLNIGNNSIESIPAGYRAMDGLFQALAVRSGGFYIVPIASLRIGVQVLYVLMMYISVYPVVITMRNSNVYEERSLGIYAEDPLLEQERKEKDLELGRLGRLKRSVTLRAMRQPVSETRGYFLKQQVRGQLAHDLSWLAVAVLLIVCIENSSFEADPVNHSVFNVVFEVVSGYGSVGITIGLPDQAYSFCGSWHVVSKLILCAVMIRGRHRGLPVAIDRAVQLPGGDERLGVREEEDNEIRRAKSREGI
jgi:Trk-type K+ transport system membrane component